MYIHVVVLKEMIEMYRNVFWCYLDVFVNGPTYMAPLGSPAETGCTVKQIRSWSDSTRSVSVSWTCHPTNFGLIGHMQEKNRGGGAKLSMLAYVGCWSHCGSWSLSYTVVLSCVMEKTVCYHVLPVLTSRSCRSQEIIRGAIHWLRRVCVCCNRWHA